MPEGSAKDSTRITEVANSLTATVAKLLDELSEVSEISAASRVNSKAVEDAVNIQQDRLQELMADIGGSSGGETELF